jgi:hypothetical protein
MKKSNKQREALLQKKRTKRNQSRKGATYNPNKFKVLNESQAEKNLQTGEAVLVL